MTQPDIVAVKAHLIASPGEAFALADRDTADRSLFPDKKAARVSLRKDAAVIDELQELLYATRRKALLIILQGMDTAGKSGVIRNVFAYTSPLGLQVEAFKAPTELERGHDYLWRIHQAVPRRGWIGLFDRSHYEDVLVARVRGLAPAETVARRYGQINAFEQHLTENDVVVLKFMLHLGFEEQGARLRERLSEAHKRWKFAPTDLEDRAQWASFMQAYEDMVRRCSTDTAPWYVVPADSRSRRNAMIARIVRGALEGLDMAWPQPDHDVRPRDII